uniref:Centriolar satellite-associated tubulin polyglutamylase complex regulator 1 n=1 Tax=Sinocyclocheilus grahami TaxID=75366 RepID=A0A672RAH2_SINGR
MGIMCSSGNSVTSRRLLTTESPSSISSGNASDRLERMGVSRGKSSYHFLCQAITLYINCLHWCVYSEQIRLFLLADLLAMAEYSSLLQLLCPDFPTEMVQNAARIVLIEDATDCLMSFSDFIYSFQIQFYFEEFVESVSVIYQDLLSGKSPNTVIVPTSTSVEQLSSAANEEPDAQGGVDSSIFCECIEGLCERFKHKFPSSVAIKEILESSQRVSFYGFLMALAKHEGVNQDIGALPNKPDLLIDPEMDQELERLIAQVAISPTSNNNSSSSAAGQKETSKKASPRKSLHQRKRIEMESDGSTEETDSSEN